MNCIVINLYLHIKVPIKKIRKKVSFSKETGCLTNSVSAEYRKIYFQIYIYQIRVMFEYICLPVWPSG